MSLVEKALRKLQEAAPRVPVETGPHRPAVEVIAKPSDTSSHRVSPGTASGAPERVVPLNASGLRAAGLLPPEHEERRIAQQYRQIKRPLIVNAIGRLILYKMTPPGEAHG